MGEQIDLIKRKRARAKGKITRIETYLGRVIDVENVNEIEVRQNLLVKAYEEFNEIQDELEDHYKIVDIDLQNEFDNEREFMENKYISLYSKLKALIQTVEGNQAHFPTNENSLSPRSGQSQAGSSQPAGNRNVKLPSINIPTFEGNYGEWRTFLDLFVSGIDNDTTLAKSQKFLYLKGSLKGEALSVINELKITDENYERAMDLLKSKYNKREPVLKYHIRELLELSVGKGQLGLKEFVSKIKQHLYALEALEIDVQSWDLLLVCILSSKIDKGLRNQYELQRQEGNDNTLPTVKEFLIFLEKRIMAWENSYIQFNLDKATSDQQKKSNSNFVSHTQTTTVNSTYRQKCIYCKDLHYLNKCDSFKSLPLQMKREFIIKNKLCFNCLKENHNVNQCVATKCKTCGGKHHTLIHDRSFEQTRGKGNVTGAGTFSSQGSRLNNHNEGNSSQAQHFLNQQGNSGQFRVEEGQANLNTNEGIQHNQGQGSLLNQESLSFINTDPGSSSKSFVRKQQILLATAKVRLISNKGKVVYARALLDSASQTSFITRDMVNNLNDKVIESNLQISGISQNSTSITQVIKVRVESIGSERYTLICGIVPKITCYLPQVRVDLSKFEIPKNIQLADNEFHSPGKVDILIGADLYYDLIESGKIKLGTDLPTLINSKLGWIIGGPVPIKDELSVNLSIVMFTKLNIEELLPRFWQLEELSNTKIMTREDKLCESNFYKTTERNNLGRFVVNLPLKTAISELNLGDSFCSAKRRFLTLEKRLHRDETLFNRYKDFIDEYVSLGHGSYVPLELKTKDNLMKYFLPHHCVIREESVSTKLRVVFDASAKTTSGLSLNDVMFKGPSVQPELFDIVCRFRLFQIVLISDIVKMYRQVRVSKKHQHLLNIIWRENPKEQLKCIQLETVTYGTNCAPYLATKCVAELGLINSTKYPLAAKILQEQCYMDDILGGASSIKECKLLKEELIALLRSGGFELHKWVSNCKELIDEKVEIQGTSSTEEKLNKILGISWDSKADQFGVVVPAVFKQGEVSYTKRMVLAMIASLFDPLGLIGPVMIKAKVLMQKIWFRKLEWDQELPEDLVQEWGVYVKNIQDLSKLKIWRPLVLDKLSISFELHGFSDASIIAYGCCFYLRVFYSDRLISCRLICSKSRVAPLKTVSLPRLELCGFMLMARLYHRLSSVLPVTFDKVLLWTDSKIVLAWLNSAPTRWTTFVANRVSEIQELTGNTEWRYIATDCNPADFVSRGLDPRLLLECKAWWHGPKILQDQIIEEENRAVLGIQEPIPEQRVVSHVNLERFQGSIELFSRFSRFLKLQRVIAFCLRFVQNTKRVGEKLKGCLSVWELNRSEILILRLIQGYYFADELECLKQKKEIKSSRLVQLAPFLDDDCILRVGGRLNYSDVSFSQKHPIILPLNAHITKLIIRQEHLNLYHAGPQNTLAKLRLKFWPIHGLQQVKKELKNCVTCHRFKAAVANQLMAPLPKDRVLVGRPFSKIGVDFGGPFLVKESRLRKSITRKSYIALFVCFVTRAIHLELVSDLSSENFLNTLKRFISRRGCPKIIYSDNATNFQGANNKLKEIHDFFKNSKDVVYDYASRKEISWKFIPANSPHWGGLWEAGIKSTKYHLNRTIGKSILSYEQFTTLLCEIEAILNSRPITPVSSDPMDFNCLTPNHFLIGGTMSTFLEKDVQNIPNNRLTYWEQINKLKQSFWKRWSTEYLNRLQNRPKWYASKSNLEIGSLVLLKDDKLPPLEWKLARVVKVYAGSDNKVRVATVRTKSGIFDRSIAKLCPLPIS